MKISKRPYKGCRDFFPEDMRLRNYIFEVMHKTSKLFAYEQYDGPILEEVALYKAKSGEELINEQIYSFEDRGERQVAIRPEMTPTLARMVANIHKQAVKPLRWYSIPNLMRYERPQKGRLREHWQFNVDIFGAANNLGEFEIIDLAATLMRNFGATPQMYSILINDREVVDFIFSDLLKLSSDEQYKLYKIVDKAKKVPQDKLEEMSDAIFTNKEQKDIFFSYLSLKTFDDLKHYLNSHAIDREFKIFELIKNFRLSPCFEVLEYDPTIVRGLDYYTGIVFEVFDKHPDNRRAIAGGGAYANLLQIFNEPALAGVGFGMGDVTLKDFLATHDLLPTVKDSECDIFLAYMQEDDFSHAYTVATQLRNMGLKIEVSLNPLKVNKVFKLAQGKGLETICLIGESERENHSFILKNIKTRQQKEVHLKDLDNKNRSLNSLIASLSHS